MRHSTFYCVGVVLLALSSTANANTFRFDTDPFAGTDVLNVPGRQIVGGEDFISFSIATDVFSLESNVFRVGSNVDFVNAPVSDLPATGVNVVVLQSIDDDNNPLTPFGAGNAANLIAGKITTPGAGFFIYFNQALDLPRLVYSTDLSSESADLKILARILNLNGAEGRNLLPTFTAPNFTITTTAAAVPEPFSAFLTLPALGVLCCYVRRRSRLTNRKRAEQ
ncbi:MAG TPA: hypothetical protein VMJ75_27885 [Candidatus Acidoferrales bacterium]|nr:hypothetical protein [Candidatus Acidoferrales bacterium]